MIFHKPETDIAGNYCGTWQGFGKIMDWLVPVIGEYRMGREEAGQHFVRASTNGQSVEGQKDFAPKSFFSVLIDGRWVGHKGGSIKIAAGKVALSVALNAWPVQVREKERTP